MRKGGVILQRFPELTEWPAYALDAIAMKGESQERLDGAGTQFPLALSAYQNVPERILAGKPYPLEMLFLLNANPVYDMPNGGRTLDALTKVPFVVSFASTLDESAAQADLILPASTFLEVWGDDYLEGTGYAGISLRRPVVETVHDTRDPGDVLIDLAQRLGGAVGLAFPWTSYKDLITERLSKFDWEKLEANGNWSELVYFNAEPGSPAWSDVVGRDRLNAPKDGRFDFFSRELFALLASNSDQACLPHFEIPATLMDSTADSIEYPFLLVTQPLITQSRSGRASSPLCRRAMVCRDTSNGIAGSKSDRKRLKPWASKTDSVFGWSRRLNREQAAVRIYAGIWPNAVFLPPGMGHHTFVRWGRKSAQSMVVGANPNALTEFESEPLTGLAVAGPTRVRIYPV